MTGLDQWVVDWEQSGARIKSFQEDTPGAIHWSGRMPDESYFFRSGWTFSRVGAAVRSVPVNFLPSRCFCYEPPPRFHMMTMIVIGLGFG